MQQLGHVRDGIDKAKSDIGQLRELVTGSEAMLASVPPAAIAAPSPPPGSSAELDHRRAAAVQQVNEAWTAEQAHRRENVANSRRRFGAKLSPEDTVAAERYDQRRAEEAARAAHAEEAADRKAKLTYRGLGSDGPTLTDHLRNAVTGRPLP